MKEKLNICINAVSNKVLSDTLVKILESKYGGTFSVMFITYGNLDYRDVKVIHKIDNVLVADISFSFRMKPISDSCLYTAVEIRKYDYKSQKYSDL